MIRMKYLKFILIFISLICIGCINKEIKSDERNTSQSVGNISNEEIRAQLGNNYNISVASINANYNEAFMSNTLDTTIRNKYKIADINDNKTLQRVIDSARPFDSQMVNFYQFASLPKFGSHFLNYNVDCNVPLVRISAYVDDYCTLSITTKDNNDKYVTLPLYKVVSITGYSGKVTSKIEGCEIKRVIEETFGTSSSYLVNGIDLKPKRKKEQVFKLSSDGRLTLIDEKIFPINLNYFE
jgi:hypothetical protein